MRDTQPGVRRVILFGSFACGVPTPRSDADIFVEVEGSLTRAQRREAAAVYTDLFQRVSVPVEVYVCTSSELKDGLEAGSGVAAVALRTGIRLA